MNNLSSSPEIQTCAAAGDVRKTILRGPRSGGRELQAYLVPVHAALIGTHDSAKVIASRLGLSEATVKCYAYQIYRELDAPNGRLELMRREIERLKAEAGR